jgi:tetratricopeptide (TPR) repeat protein
MNELFADFKALMLSAISELQAHAERLMFEPECRARDRQIQTTVEQAIRISNRIKDRKAFRSDEYQQLQDSTGVAPKETQEEEQKLLRLYDLASIVMTPEQDMDLCTFAEMLTEKGELFASTYGKEEDAIALYDEALVILGYETSQKPFEGNNFRQVADLLNKKGLVLIQRGKRCSENVGDFETALESFQKGRLVTEARLDQDQIVNFDLQLSADILENEGILLYRELQRPKDAQSKLEESLARKVAIVGAEGPGVDGTLKHLWVIIKGLSDFNIDIHKDEEELISRCSSIFRVHQILCKRRPSDLLSGLDGIKSSINSFFEQFFDTNTISEVVAALSGGEDGLSSSSPAIYEWGAAALRAVFVVGAINGKKYENKEVDIVIKALLSAAKRQGDHPGVALQTMETFLLLRGQGSSAIRSNLRQEIILAILVILGVHKSHADVRLPALEVLQYLVRKYDDAIFNATDRVADGGKNERVANVSLQVAVDGNSKLVDQLKNVILSLERVGGRSESDCEYASTMSRVQADLSVAFSNSKKLEEMARAAAATKAAEPKEYLDVDKALEDSRILKLAISEGAVKLLLSCLDNVLTADPALQILAMISENEHKIVAESFAKSVAYADGQVIIERCMQAHATHPAIRMNGKICLEKCNDWFTKMEVNKVEITTRCSAAIKKVVRRAAASANASTKAALSIKMCHDGNLESAKMARTEAAEAYRSAGKDPAKELANVDELISEIEIAADAVLLKRIANLTSAQGSALMALKVEEKNNYWMTTTQGGPVSFFSFELLDKDGDGLLTLEEYKAGFDVLDMDNDGFISAKEFGCASGAPFKLLDKDGDGKLSRAEYEAGFKLFDIDGDGQISKEEFNGAVAPKFSFEALDSDGEKSDFRNGGESI